MGSATSGVPKQGQDSARTPEGPRAGNGSGALRTLGAPGLRAAPARVLPSSCQDPSKPFQVPSKVPPSHSKPLPYRPTQPRLRQEREVGFTGTRFRPRVVSACIPENQTHTDNREGVGIHPAGGNGRVTLLPIAWLPAEERGWVVVTPFLLSLLQELILWAL